MPVEDINRKPFDEATISKLEIFERYLEAWLPVFIQSPHFDHVLICDFFAGSGCDTQGCPGSPLRILRMIEKYKDLIVRKRLSIRVIFNDLIPDKVIQLESLISSEVDKVRQDFNGLVSLEYHTDEFRKLFEDHYDDFKRQPNLIFLDQNGIKEINDDVFRRLIALDRTDFLFFISSSYLRRFAGEDCFRAYFPDLDPDTLRTTRHEDVHRVILEYYREKIPLENQMRLYPFSFKKGPNIYGLVFGSKHALGVEKFLNIAWKKNNLNGEANFDIDGDVIKRVPSLFPELQRPTKLELFDQELEKYIFSSEKLTNRDLFDFTLANGHAPRQALDVLRKLRKAGKVQCEGRIGCSYRACYKDKSIKQIKVVNNG